MDCFLTACTQLVGSQPDVPDLNRCWLEEWNDQTDQHSATAFSVPGLDFEPGQLVPDNFDWELPEIIGFPEIGATNHHYDYDSGFNVRTGDSDAFSTDGLNLSGFLNLPEIGPTNDYYANSSMHDSKPSELLSYQQSGPTNQLPRLNGFINSYENQSTQNPFEGDGILTAFSAFDNRNEQQDQPVHFSYLIAGREETPVPIFENTEEPGRDINALFSEVLQDCGYDDTQFNWKTEDVESFTNLEELDNLFSYNQPKELEFKTEDNVNFDVLPSSDNLSSENPSDIIVESFDVLNDDFEQGSSAFRRDVTLDLQYEARSAVPDSQIDDYTIKCGECNVVFDCIEYERHVCEPDEKPIITDCVPAAESSTPIEISDNSANATALSTEEPIICFDFSSCNFLCIPSTEERPTVEPSNYQKVVALSKGSPVGSIDQTKTENLLQLFERNKKVTAVFMETNFDVDSTDRNRNVSSNTAKPKCSQKNNKDPYKCTLCDRQFVHESGLKKHIEKHVLDLIPVSDKQTKQGDHIVKTVIKCLVCGEILFHVNDALNHLRENHYDKYEEGDDDENLDPERIIESKEEVEIDLKSISDYFSKEVSDKLSMGMQKYFELYYLNSVLRCEFCDLCFCDVESLLSHEYKHDPCIGYECNKCKISVPTVTDIFLHGQNDCIMKLQTEKDATKGLETRFVCNVCKEKLESHEELLDHRYVSRHFFPRMNGQEFLIACEYCAKKFRSPKILYDHYVAAHKKKCLDNKREECSKQKFDKKFRQYLCHTCGKTYTQSSHLWQHLRFHEGIKPFKCSEPNCERRFTIRPDLNDHIRKCHTGERPYHCTTCGKRFLTGSVYYQHRLIHLGERRYGCSECSKRFYRADALKNHQRIHTGEKPYECGFCLKRFRQRGDRDKHIRARHYNAEANNRAIIAMNKTKKNIENAQTSHSSNNDNNLIEISNIQVSESMLQGHHDMPDI